MRDVDALVAEMRAGLEGVTPGPWRPSTFGFQIVSDYPEAAWQSVVELRTKPQTFPRVEDERASQEAIARHLARCSPENIAALLDALESERSRADRLEKALENIANRHSNMERGWDPSSMRHHARAALGKEDVR